MPKGGARMCMTPQVRFAEPADMTGIEGVVQAAAPDLTEMHHDWDHRLGQGRHVDEPFTLVAARDAEVVGAAWVDRALNVDHELPLAWWQLNLVAVTPRHQGQGIGQLLVHRSIEIARIEPKVERLHGQCPLHLAGWYSMQGFHLLEPGEGLATGLQQVSTGKILRIAPTDGYTHFVMDFQREDDAVGDERRGH